MVIAVDFDGTCVTHEFPNIGKDIGAVPILKELIKKGHKLILYTMRSGDLLEEAVNWFAYNGIELYGVNKNPEQYKWTSSPKVFASIYIDDAALGVPLKLDEDRTISRPYVDWNRLRELLKREGVL